MTIVDPNARFEQQTTGTVKWYDVRKGIGFIRPDDCGPDILLHANVLANSGQNSIVSGACVTFETYQTERGLAVSEIIQINSIPQVEASNEGRYALTSEADEFLPGRVGWFDDDRGIGFATVFGSNDQYFLHRRILEQAGVTTLFEGEGIAVRIGENAIGKQVAEMKVWSDVSTH